MQFTKQNVLVQKFVAESKGRDIRAFVVGDRVVAAMRRVALGNEFRSNVHRGGQTEPVELSEKDQDAFRDVIERFLSLYQFISQILNFVDTKMEKMS